MPLAFDQIKATGNPSSTTFLAGDGVWRTPGAGPSTSADVVINGLLAATDRLIDLRTDMRVSLDSQVPYFCQVVAAQSATIGGMAIRLQYTAYCADNNGGLNNAVGLYDLAGNRLAAGDALNTWRNGGSWNRVAFSTTVNIVAGTRYVLGIMVDSNSPGFNCIAGNSEINALIPVGGLPRCFRKSGVSGFSAASLDFTTNITPNTGDRPFMSLVV